MTITELTPLFDRLDELNVDYSASISRGRKISSIWVSGVRATHEHYHPILNALTSAFDRLDKTISSGVQSWEASKDGTTLKMYHVASCKVTGYRTVERKKTVEVETDEIEIDEVPVYDCSETE